MNAHPLELVPEPASAKWATALASAQADMPPIAKNRSVTVRTDKGAYSYSYADLADIFAAVRPVLAKHELAVTQDVQVQDGKVLCYTTIWHSSGESHSFGPVTLGAGSTPQNAGSAITYARRYGLSAALGIATEEDDDAQQTSKKEAKPKPAPQGVPAPSDPQSEPHTGRTASDSKATAAVARTDGNVEPPSGDAGNDRVAGSPRADKLEAVKAFLAAIEQRFPNKSKTVKLAYVNRWVKDDVKLTDVNEKQVGESFTEEELKNLTAQILKEIG